MRHPSDDDDAIAMTTERQGWDTDTQLHLLWEYARDVAEIDVGHFAEWLAQVAEEENAAEEADDDSDLDDDVDSGLDTDLYDGDAGEADEPFEV